MDHDLTTGVTSIVDGPPLLHVHAKKEEKSSVNQSEVNALQFIMGWTVPKLVRLRLKCADRLKISRTEWF